MAQKCPNLEENLKHCTCSYMACGTRGMCCACILKHRRAGEIPGCLFTKEGEKSYDRSISNFVKDHS